MLRFVIVYDARFADALSVDPAFKIRTDSAIRGILHPFLKFRPIWRSVDPSLKIQTDSAVCGTCFKNSDRFGGPWVPASLLKHRTNSAVRESLDSL